MGKWLNDEKNIVFNFYGKKGKSWLIERLKNKYTWEAIKQQARKLGVTNKRKKGNTTNVKWTADKIDKFKLMWMSASTEELKNEFSNFTYEALTSAARRFNVKRDLNLRFSNKLEKLLIENSYNYYWLGFIIADGHFSNRNELKISLSVLDIEHLNILANYLDVNINVYNGLKYGKYTSNDYCMLSVMDVKSVPELIKRFNINGSKTYNSCSLNCVINNENLLPFFCGFIDGDGCITKSNTGKANMLRIQCHSSWLENLSMISERLNKTYGFNSKCYIDTQGYTRFVMYRYSELLKLKYMIDKYNIPYLNRKWDKIC